MTITVDQLYGDLWANDDAAFDAIINQSLNPRGPDILFDHMAALGVEPADLVLDVGCRDAGYAIELVQRFGCRALAVDPIPVHIERAGARIAAAGLTERVTAVAGRIESLPAETGSIDHIWCRDVLNHVDLPTGLAECARVLRLGGGMLVYQTVATDLMEPNEATRLYSSMAIIPENMSAARVEATAAAAGFTILTTDPIDSEWRERWAEEGSRALLDDLLSIARLRRARPALIERFGSARYEATLGGRLWGIYQMLGKLRPTVYLLRKSA